MDVVETWPQGDSRRRALLTQLEHWLTRGIEVRPGSIPDFNTVDQQVEPAVPADLVASALRSVPADKVVRPGLQVHGLTILGDLDLSFLDFAQGLQFTNCTFTGSIDLSEARVAALRLHQSKLTSAEGVYSLNASELEVADSLVLPAEVKRPINLAAVRIGGNLAGCPVLVSELKDSWVLDALGLEVGGVISIGTPQHKWGGAINLWGAEVGGGVRIAGILHQPADGPALDLSWSEVGEDLDLHVRVEGVTNPSHVVIQVPHLTVKRDLVIHLALRDGSVDATNATAGGCFRTEHENLPPVGALLLSGLDAGEMNLGTLPEAVPGVRQLTRLRLGDFSGCLSDDGRLASRWLDGASTFTAQPWEEMARVYAANGQPAYARRMRYGAARRATRQSPLGTRALRTLYWATTGHGYYPGLALAWLLVLFLAAAGLTSWNHDQFTTPATPTITRLAEQKGPSGSRTETQPSSEVVKGRVTADQCQPRQWDTPCLSDIEYAISSTLSPVAAAPPWLPPAGWVSWALLLIKALAWVFVALLLAGVTGLLRRQ